jgi:hypothetical protein
MHYQKENNLEILIGHTMQCTKVYNVCSLFEWKCQYFTVYEFMEPLNKKWHLNVKKYLTKS